MWSFGAFCDEFYVSSRLYLKLDLEPSRETVLHFLEQLRRAYPQMSRLRRRDDGGLMLDEEAQEGHGRRYVRIDTNALKFGCFNPPDLEAVDRFGGVILAQAPAHLTLSELDYDYMEAVYTFDLEYRGNHDDLIADSFLTDHPLMKVLTAGEERVIDCQPFVGVTISEDCQKQVYLEIKGRTSTYEVRTGDYDATPLSVVLTVRRYWSAGGPTELHHIFRELLTIGEQYAAERVVPNVVQPLAAAIASRR